MANTSFTGPVRSQNGFQGYNVDAAGNASLTLGAQGTGVVLNTSSVTFFQTTATTVSTAGAVTYTAAQIKTGLILRDPNGAARADLFPTAANLLAAVPGAIVGTSFVVTIRNTADAAETITMTTNTGLTLSGTMTIAQGEQKDFLIRFTNVGTAAATIYSMTEGSVGGANNIVTGQVLYGASAGVVGSESNLFWDASNNRLGIGTNTPTVALDVVGTVNSTGVAVTGNASATTFSAPLTTPASATAPGVAGTIVWDASYIYVCTATDTWKRVAISTWP